MQTQIFEHPFVYNLWSRFSKTHSLTAVAKTEKVCNVVHDNNEYKAVGNQIFHCRDLLMIGNKLES